MPCRCATSCATAPYSCSFRSNSPEQPDQSNALFRWTPIGGQRPRNRAPPPRSPAGIQPSSAARERLETKKSAGTRMVPADPPVELRGLEPLTPCMPCRCATSCATAPDCCCSFKLSPGLPRSNSNILEQQFRKFQIGNIHSPHTFTARARPTRCRLLRRLWRMRRPRAAGPPRGNPSRAAPVRRTPGPPHAGRG